MTGDKSHKMSRGFTIIETLVAASIFVTVVAISTGIFVSSIKAQRRNLAYQQLLDQTSYLVEHMFRVIRMAKKDISGACTGTEKSNYSFSGDCLKFLYRENGSDVCQHFCLSGNILLDENGQEMNSDELQIEKFNVDIFGQLQSDDDQPLVTVFLEVKGEEQTKTRIQFTVSQRNLDVQK